MGYNSKAYSIARHLDPLYPDEYLDWEVEVEKYFECTQMSEWKKVRLAIRKLTRHAQWHWEDIEDEYYRRGDEEITWKFLRSRLREKYLGRSYEQKLVSQWYLLEQGNQTVSEYFNRFNQLTELCRTVGPESSVISRFCDGLHRDIQWELFKWKITTLEEAFHIARDFELHQINQSKPKPRPNTVPLDQPAPTIPSQAQGPSSVGPIPQPIHATPLTQSTATPRVDHQEKEVDVIKLGLADQENTQIDNLGDENLEPVIDYIEEIYEADQDLIDQYIKEKEIVLEEQPGCERDSPIISDVSPETFLEELIEPVKDVESSPTVQEQHEKFEDLFLSSPYPPEDSHLMIPIENIFPEINDLSSHRVSLPAPDHPFTIQEWFLNSKSMSVISETIPDTNSYSLPLPESAYNSKATRCQFVEVAKLHQAPEPIKFATYFRKTLWHLLGAHVTFSATHHPSTRGQA